MEIHEAIKVGMKKKGYSQTRLAEIMNVEQSAVNFWVNGKTIPSGDKLVKIAKELDIVGEIFEGSIDKENDDLNERLDKMEQEIKKIRSLVKTG